VPPLAHDDGKDFVPTNRWIVFGHRFATSAGRVHWWSVLAANSVLPGTLWILISAHSAAACRMIVLFSSVRRRGRDAGPNGEGRNWARRGRARAVSVLLILIMIMALLALVVVRRSQKSVGRVHHHYFGRSRRSWAWLRSGRISVRWVTAFGIVGLALAVWGGQFLENYPAIGSWFRQAEKWR
jgi:carbon starvation protein